MDNPIVSNSTPPVPNSQEPLVVTSADPTSVTKDPGKNRTWLIIGAIIGSLVLITLIAISATILVLNNRVVPAPTPPPNINATPAAIPIIPTKYSTDSAILQLRDDLKLLMAKTDTVDLVEPEIAPPNIDLNLNIPPLQ